MPMENTKMTAIANIKRIFNDIKTPLEIGTLICNFLDKNEIQSFFISSQKI